MKYCAQTNEKERKETVQRGGMKKIKDKRRSIDGNNRVCSVVLVMPIARVGKEKSQKLKEEDESTAVSTARE